MVVLLSFLSFPFHCLVWSLPPSHFPRLLLLPNLLCLNFFFCIFFFLSAFSLVSSSFLFFLFLSLLRCVVLLFIFSLFLPPTLFFNYLSIFLYPRISTSLSLSIFLSRFSFSSCLPFSLFLPLFFSSISLQSSVSQSPISLYLRSTSLLFCLLSFVFIYLFFFFARLSFVFLCFITFPLNRLRRFSVFPRSFFLINPPCSPRLLKAQSYFSTFFVCVESVV